MNDRLLLESEYKYKLYLDKNNLYFGFNLSNPIDADYINKLCKDWKRNKIFKEDYFNLILKFDNSINYELFKSNKIKGHILHALIYFKLMHNEGLQRFH